MKIEMGRTRKHPNPSTISEGFANIAKDVIIRAVLDIKGINPTVNGHSGGRYGSIEWVKRDAINFIFNEQWFDFWLECANFTQYKEDILKIAKEVLRNEKS